MHDHNNLRKTGVDVLGDVPWGTHFCQFYETKEDLLELLIPYFKTGLANSEFCLWIVFYPIKVEDAFELLKVHVPNFQQHIEKNSIEILPYTEWYFRDGKFDGKAITNAITELLQNALKRGYAGLRINGNETWLESNDWADFMEYEKELNVLVQNKPVIILCTYPLSHSSGATLLDVADAHEAVIAKRKGGWAILEKPEFKKVKADLVKENEALDALIAERTNELENAVKELKKEIDERKEAEDKFVKEKELSKAIRESFPGIVNIIDENYRILEWNRMFEIFTGYTAQEIPHLHILNDLHDISDRERAFDLHQQAFANITISGDFKIRTKDGSIRQVFIISRRINYEDKPCLIICGIDITERKNAEEQIKRQIELTNEIIDTIPVMTWIILPDGTLDFVTKRWIKYTGISREELIRQPTLPIHPDDLPRILENWRVNMATGQPFDDEMRLQGADGKYRWFLVRSAPLCDRHGQVLKWFGVSIDIEDRRRTEEKLRQSENLLTEAEKIAHVGSWSLDLHTNIATSSDELYRMFGIKKSDFDHSLESVFNLIHPHDRGLVRRVVKEAITARAPYDFYFRRIMPDKKVRIIHARGTVMTDAEGNAVRLYGASQDVTESREAEDKLRLAYQRLSYHVENTPLAVIEWDKDLNITRWSGQAEKIFGWKASEVLGRNRYDPDFLIVYKDDEKKVAKVDYELMNGLVERNLSLNRNYTKDGKVVYCKWYNSVLKDNQGNVITILSLTHDVTERKKAEEKLTESYREIRLLSEHLQNIREEERTHIAREIHDELGQQLTVIKMDLLCLSEKISDNDDIVKQRFHDLTEILDATMETVRKISYELRPNLLDLGLDDAIEWHLKEFEKRSAIKTSFYSSEEELDLDDSTKTGLFRIFQESLTNVARHSKASHVQVEIVKETNEIILRIYDNGRGFDISEAAKKKTLGILGMKERAEMMSGSYNIESIPGKGTTVTTRISY
ncbi:PAS domain S-box protein [Danxiaibacter flavus]|uniref:histidine kinase n=1 Tax=Danxiaibacter flavus TaxID=3049108 RepID=A0ABV3ZLL9_9BACT|nr:PAS domain S-box protein [Chitinophagaceae bacterium DXS]